MYKETKIRSVFKTVTWRICATLTTITLVLLFTKRMDLALSVGGIEVVLKMIIYFLHERTWDRVQFGRKEIQPAVIWLTGYAGAGKTTIAKALEQRLIQDKIRVDHLDGETVRDIFPKVGFTPEEVDQHIKRVGYLSSRLENKGISVIASFLSPYRESRNFVKKLCTNFFEVHVATPLEVCEQRQDGGLYKKARAGEIRNLPGVDIRYEPPDEPSLTVDTSIQSTEEIVEQIMNKVKIS